ncbi:MAG: hypothetical protein M3355_02480 [Actinomycetota bacterium]|nr:hypothetical protein [Actinomycetota bacterium]
MAIQRTQEIRDQLESAVAEGASTAEVVQMATEMASAAAGTVGECRIGSKGFAELYPVLDDDGLRWCCTHETQHSTAIVVSAQS